MKRWQDTCYVIQNICGFISTDYLPYDQATEQNLEILSSPSSSQTSVVGKEEWMEKNLPGVKLNLEQSNNKQVYAEPNAILIDDREDIIERWNKAGGIGIHHTSAENTIKQLKELGFEWYVLTKYLNN